MNLTTLMDVLKQIPDLLALALRSISLSVLDWLYASSPAVLGTVALVFVGLILFGALRLQAWLRRVHRPASDAGRTWNRLLRRELRYSPFLWLLLALGIAAFVQLALSSAAVGWTLGALVGTPLLIAALIRVVRFVARWRLQRQQASPAEGAASSAEGSRSSTAEATPGSGKAVEADRPRLVLTLGPTYFLASMWILGLYILARLAEPLLAGRVSGVAGLSSWEVLLVGSWPQLEMLLPLSERPYLSALLSLLLWVTVWWLLSLVMRLRYQSLVLRDQLPHRRGTSPPELRLWAEVSGAEPLWKPADNYRRWMVWVVVVATLVPPLAWLHLTGDPYRLDPSMFALAVVLWLGLVLNLALRGTEVKLKEETLEGAEVSLRPSPGWAQVCEVLERGKVRVGPREGSYPCHRLQSHSWPLTVTPLARELLPRLQGGRFSDPTRLQAQILNHLGNADGHEVASFARTEELSFGTASGDKTSVEDEVLSRHHAVLAPEGSGKTTLAVLAAVDQAVTQTRCTLVVLRSPEDAERFRSSFQDVLGTSSLRWTIRVRQPGHDLMNDLGRGIVPDVVVCSLQDLVVHVLERADVFAPFLGNVGLVVLDDVESFFGPVEAHAKLAFRRLQLRLRGLSRYPADDPRYGVSYLTLGCDSMHRAEEWVETLLGVEVAVHTYGADRAKAAVSEQSEGATDEVEAGGEGQEAGAGDAGASRGGAEPRRDLFRLRSFLDESQESITFLDLVQACEAAEVPWLYRYCGDGSRHLGRRLLPLREEPQFAVRRPEDAAVLLLEGTWSELHREIERLPYAGRRFLEGQEGIEQPVGPIAMVTFTDPDVESAFSYDDDSMPLASALRSMPRPILRPPTGAVVEPHLAADLVQHWIEVHDLVTAFGEPVVDRLVQLERDGLLQQDAITDIAESESRYERKVFLQAHARALRGEQDLDDSTQSRRLLPPRVAQVELAVPEAIELRDRTRMEVLDQVEAVSAMMLFYPGSIFRDARGTFVVAEWMTRADDDDQRVVGAVVVEPIQSLEITSPRRRVVVRWDSEEPGAEDPIASASEESRESSGEEVERDLRIAAGGGFLDRHEILSGQLPMKVQLQPAEVEVEHIATFRLTPLRRRVMQRSLETTGPTAQGQPWNRTFRTVALGLYPNVPVKNAADDVGEANVGELTVGGARLLAAAMRAVLPCLYRGGGSALGLALLLEKESASTPGAPPSTSPPGEVSLLVSGGLTSISGRPLTPEEGFVFFDVARAGNGACRALYRDGVELLLRLCQLLLEGLPSVQRLRLLYDHFGDRDEILREASEEEAGPRDRKEYQHCRNESNKLALHNARQWLETHLGSEAAQGMDGEPQIDEDEDWDKFFPPSLGRCLYVAPGRQPDVKWALLRWRQLSDNYEIRVGFDRETLLRSSGACDAQLVEKHQALLRSEALQDGALAFAPMAAGVKEVRPPGKESEASEVDSSGTLDAGAAERQGWWHRLLVLLRLRAKAPAQGIAVNEALTESATGVQGNKRFRQEARQKEGSLDAISEAQWSVFARAWSVYIEDGYRLGRVADRLVEASGKVVAGSPEAEPMVSLSTPRLTRLHFLITFVANLRGDGQGPFEPLVQSLLQNRLNGATRCLLLAALLERKKVSSGLFVQRDGHKVLLAMDVTQGLRRFGAGPVSEDPKGSWSSAANLGAPPSLYLELRVDPKSLARLPAATASELEPLCFVPIDPNSPRPFAGPLDEKPERWYFLPLGRTRTWLSTVRRAEEEAIEVEEEPTSTESAGPEESTRATEEAAEPGASPQEGADSEDSSDRNDEPDARVAAEDEVDAEASPAPLEEDDETVSSRGEDHRAATDTAKGDAS